MRITFWIYKILKPLFSKLEQRCQKEIARLNKLEVARIVEETLARLRKDRAQIDPEERLRRSAIKLEQMENLQDVCMHLKGGPLKPFYGRDYNISIHTFINGDVRARCLVCGKVWWKSKVSTEIWQGLQPMLDSSTNIPSSSEVLLP